MSHCKRKPNILQLLQKRESNPGPSAYRISLNIMREAVLSNNTKFHQSWYKKSNKPIVYEGGHFYLNNNTTCYTLYGHQGKTRLSYILNPNGKICSVTAYLAPVTKDILDPNYENLPLSRYFIFITKNSWLYVCNWETGIISKELYIKPFNEQITFKHCDWNIYHEQIILTSGLSPKGSCSHHSDVVVSMAVLNVHPLEFYALLDIKRSVFGRTCFHANVSDQMLIIGLGSQAVRIYNFTEVLKGGVLHPYKLGDDYPPHGKVGEYPVGLPFNLIINSAPAILFEVQGYDQMVNFGGYPFHYLYLKMKNDANFILKTLEGKDVKNGILRSSLWLSDNAYAVYFHPDGSNRILQKTSTDVQCYKIVSDGNNSELKKVYAMEFPPDDNRHPYSEFSLFGRKLTKRVNERLFEKHILATDYEDELELFAILGTQPRDSIFTSTCGYVKLFETTYGKEVKSLCLGRSLCDSHAYDLYIDLDSIIIIEKDLKNIFSVYVYTLLHTIK